MKFSTIILFLYFAGISLGVFSKNIDKDSIDSLIKLYYPKSDIKVDRLYIIDGIPFSSMQIDSFIYDNGLEIAKLLLYQPKNISNFCRNASDIVLIISRENYKINDKKNDYKKVIHKIKKLKNNIDKMPIIIVNSQKINKNIAFKLIKNFKINKINTINIYENSVSIDIFGFEAKNGLIKIEINE